MECLEPRGPSISHQQPFHNSCESVDLWAAGIVLLDMLLISSVGQMFKVSALSPWPERGGGRVPGLVGRYVHPSATSCPLAPVGCHHT